MTLVSGRPVVEPAPSWAQAPGLVCDDQVAGASGDAGTEGWVERLAGAGSWECNLQTGEIGFSRGLARLLGIPEHARLDVAARVALVHPDDRAALAQANTDCIRGGSSQCEYRVVTADGVERVLSERAELVQEAGRPAYTRGAVIDVTEERAADRERLAAEEIFRLGFDSSPVGMALSEAAVRGRCLRVNDAMCALLGCDRSELLGRSLLESFTHPAERPAVRRARARMLRGGESFRAEHRYRRADGSIAWGVLHITPMRRGDGTVEMFYAQLVDITERKEREAALERTVADAVWLGRLRDALDEQRLVLYSQPIVDLTTGETVQNELLLRLRESDGTIVAPGEFLPVAERYGLISEIDRWVIGEAVRSAAQGIPTEFNLSARSISDPSIIHELAAALEQTGADPSLLVVEVTETALADQTDAGGKFACHVHELGCRLALDDFGTGFSSLTYLKHLPADHLKIDTEFVRELSWSETDARVIRGIVGLAREFGQTTIAEGVEDERTLMALRELGVDHAQGYLFGRPAPRPGHEEAQPEPRRRSTSARKGPAPGDRTEVVRSAFEAFAARDLEAMLAHCRPDIVMRPSVTARFVDRREPYRGHDGIRAYVCDVAQTWDRFELTMLSFRETPDSVIGFGRTDARRGDEKFLADIVLIARVEDGMLASIEVFDTGGNERG